MAFIKGDCGNAKRCGINDFERICQSFFIGSPDDLDIDFFVEVDYVFSFEKLRELKQLNPSFGKPGF